MKNFLSIFMVLLLVFSSPALATFTPQGADVDPTEMIFEGATDDAVETTIAITDPTSTDKTITVPNKTGTMVLSTDIDTIAEVEGYLTTTNILVETEIDAGSELLALIDDETGTGVPVFSTTPTLVTPVLGAATATSINIASGTTVSKLVIATDTDLDSGQTSEVVTVAGATTASRCFGSITNDQTNEVSITSIVPGTGDVTVQVSADPGASGSDLVVICIN